MTVAAGAAPASTAELRDAVLEARSLGKKLRLAGRGHWLNAGRPVRAADRLSVAGLSGIVEYTPGDFTLTARAGTPLSDIARATSAHDQWLPFDPFGPEDGTIGATVATASAGPLAHGFGLPRDNVLGLEVVTGAGSVVRGGGRVVKNVAGFDLTRLFVGSWGTLGAISEVTVRLRARPAVDETVALQVADDAETLGLLLGTVRTLAVAPIALELVSRALARRIGLTAGTTLLVRLGGNSDAVRAQRQLLAGIGRLSEAPADVWRSLGVVEPPAAAVMRLSRSPARMSETWREALGLAALTGDPLVHASVGRGVARCILELPDERHVAELVERWPRGAGTCIAERLPGAVWTSVPSPVADRLSRGVKQAYDPDGILNPGILGEALA